MTVRSRYDANRMRFYDAVGEAVKAARMAAGLSQRAFADRLGISHGMVLSIEKGSTPCSLYVASQIAELFDTTIDAIAPVQFDVKGAAE